VERRQRLSIELVVEPARRVKPWSPRLGAELAEHNVLYVEFNDRASKATRSRPSPSLQSLENKPVPPAATLIVRLCRATVEEGQAA